MLYGTVKWFDETKGFGFIKSENQSKDIFVHQTDILGKGFRTLVEGERVSFELDDNGKGLAAKKVQRGE